MAIPPDIERGAAALRVAEQPVIHIRDQRRALAAGRDVARTEIRDDRQARALGEDGSFADLKRAGDTAAQKRRRTALVIHGLPVARDQIGPNSALSAGFEHGLCVQLAQKKMEPRQIRYVVQVQNRLPHAPRIREGPKRLHLETPSPHLDDRHIDAVQRSAAHDSGDFHERFSSCWISCSSCKASIGRSSSSFSPRIRSARP